MNRILRVTLISLLALCLIAINVLAHGGGTDKFGGHRNKKTGGYHYHNAGSVHVLNNPYQDHTKCGICPTSKKDSKDKESTEAKEGVTSGGKQETQKKQVYVGSSKSNKFHNPSCVLAKKIKPENLVTFGSRQAVLEAGYIPCKVCQP